MDQGFPGLSGDLDGCVTVASDLAGRSSTDAVIPDQVKIFGDIALTCSSMATAASAGDADALAKGRSDLESELDDLKEIFSAFEELMMIGDSNEPIDTTPTS
jgi:predicted translin family RNA/ssDNA-binding protein